MTKAVRKRPEPLSKWMEANIMLPSGISARPGKLKLHPHQYAIADALCDPAIEKISCIKSAQIGFTTLLVGAVAHYVCREPSPVLVVMPTESDARGLVIDSIEQFFEESPAIRDYLPRPRPGRNDHQTLTSRLFAGGSLKVVAAGAPRNLRRHSARVLIIDEVSAAQNKTEGRIVDLAMQRTMSWPNRKIIIGGTPLGAEASVIADLYAESDGRIFSVPCPACGTFSEIEWSQIEWPPGRPQEAQRRCPHCRELTPEDCKTEMVSAGEWTKQRPEVQGHAGFRINSLVSLLPACSWKTLAAKFEAAGDDPARLQPFYNTDLGLPFEIEGETVDATALSARAEDFSLADIPADVILLTLGIDCADDRVDLVLCGWAAEGTCYVLSHEALHGAIDDNLLWQQVEQILKTSWQVGERRLRIAACCIDGGDGGHLQTVLSFCRPRAARRIMCIKGMAGFGRQHLIASKSKMRGGGRLWVAGVDSVKSTIFAKLARGNTIRFSSSLTYTFYEQLQSERIETRRVGGRDVKRFTRIPGMKAECLDALTYAFCARSLFKFGSAQREAIMQQSPPEPVSPEPVSPEPAPQEPPAPPKPTNAWTTAARHQAFDAVQRPSNWVTGNRVGTKWHERW